MKEKLPKGAFRRPNAGFWRLGRQKPAFQNKRRFFFAAAAFFLQYLAALAAKYIKKYQKYHFSTRIKDAGIAIRHSQGYIISILQGPEMSLGAVDTHLKGS